MLLMDGGNTFPEARMVGDSIPASDIRTVVLSTSSSLCHIGPYFLHLLLERFQIEFEGRAGITNLKLLKDTGV